MIAQMLLTFAVDVAAFGVLALISAVLLAILIMALAIPLGLAKQTLRGE